MIFWDNIKSGSVRFIKKNDKCQKQGKIEKVSFEIHRIPFRN